jgi:integrase
VHRGQWRNTLRDYVLPVIGGVAVAAVDTSAVIKIIEPLWLHRTETASRVRGRIESILDYAKARGWREGENPARWRGHLDHLLPPQSKVQRVRHHRALPWREIGDFMERLRAAKSVSARCLEFAILAAARSGEARGARWSEIDLANKERLETGRDVTVPLWVIPGDRMKAGKEHRVPLSRAALKVLEAMMPLRDDPAGLIFPGMKRGRPLMARSLTNACDAAGADGTPHGFRSSFRDWCAEAAKDCPRELAEKALAHALESKVEEAYQRGGMIVKRQQLMQAWAEYCGRPSSVDGDNVVELRGAAA